MNPTEIKITITAQSKEIAITALEDVLEKMKSGVCGSEKSTNQFYYRFEITGKL